MFSALDGRHATTAAAGTGEEQVFNLYITRYLKLWMLMAGPEAATASTAAGK